MSLTYAVPSYPFYRAANGEFEWLLPVSGLRDRNVSSGLSVLLASVPVVPMRPDRRHPLKAGAFRARASRLRP
jgi:hypothetical protein